MILMENIMYKLDNNDAYLWLKTIENESID